MVVLPSAFTTTVAIDGTIQIVVSIRPTRTTIVEGIPKSASSPPLTIDTQSTANSPISTFVPPQKTLSRGSIAGINIAAVLGGFAIFGLIAYAFFRRGRRSTASPEMEAVEKLTLDEKEELIKLRRTAQLNDTTPAEIQELDGIERFELEARRKQIRYKPVEME